MSESLWKNKNESLVLRTCNANLTSPYDETFQWKKKGWVEAPDWDPCVSCGNGLHGALWGEGQGSLFKWTEDAAWLVVAVPTDTIVDLGGKVKFPRGRVVHCGSQTTATEFILKYAPGKKVIGSTLTGGDGSTLTGGYRSTLTGKYWCPSSERYKILVGYIGEEDGDLKAEKAYRVANGSWELAEEQER